MRRVLYVFIFLGLAASAAWAADGGSSGGAQTWVKNSPDPAMAPSIEKLLAAMPDADRQYYLDTFDYAMLNLKPGEKQDWASGDNSGYFTVEIPFVHGDTICRNYREVVVSRPLYSISSEGVGCKRVGRDGWCRLKKGDALTCALEPPDGSIKSQVESTVDDAQRDLDRTNTYGKSQWYHWSPF